MDFYVEGKRSWLGICGKNRVKKDFDEVRSARGHLRMRFEKYGSSRLCNEKVR